MTPVCNVVAVKAACKLPACVSIQSWACRPQIWRQHDPCMQGLFVYGSVMVHQSRQCQADIMTPPQLQPRLLLCSQDPHVTHMQAQVCGGG